MPEIWFYHLERQPLDQVLPLLLERTLARDWRAVVQSGSPERLEAMDTLLWTYRDDSFLPHGTKRDGHSDRQPVYLTDDDTNPNSANIRFLVDGAEMIAAEAYDRVVYLFDGADDAALSAARAAWRDVKAGPFDATYWRQNDAGRWEKH